MASSDRLHALHAAGQSIWLDYIDRPMLHDGSLARRIRDDALTGMTSNPTIFEKALAEGEAYDEQLAAARAGLTTWELFELVETEDVRTACDLFRPVYDATGGRDGYVSIEVSPGVADDPAATVAEGQRLWATVDRPNVMIKVPGTAAGVEAVEALLAAGINVNVTLLFAVAAYERVVEAYLRALEARRAAGQPIDRVASVASFFVSRVDSEIDKRLDRILAQLPDDEADPKRRHVAALKGRAAVANAQRAYRRFQELFAGPRWAPLAAAGAMVQRPLWASTGTKNPAYRDVLYVEQLVGPDTVTTLPPATLEAFRDHGETARTVDADPAGAERALADLAALGIDLDQVTDQLLGEGLASFQKSFDGLLAHLERKQAQFAAAVGAPAAG